MSFHGSGIADISCHGLEISVLDSTNTPGKTMKKSKIRPKPLSTSSLSKDVQNEISKKHRSGKEPMQELERL